MNIPDLIHSVVGKKVSDLEVKLFFEKLRDCASKNGVVIYVKKYRYSDSLYEKVEFGKFGTLSAETLLEGAEKLFFLEKNENFNFSRNEKKEPNGCISILHQGYKIYISVAGCKTDSENAFLAIHLMQVVTDLQLKTIKTILGSKFSKEN